MSRYLVVLNSIYDRAKACEIIRKAPHGTRVELKAAKRSLDQNALLWSLLTEVSVQKEHFGRRYAPEVWKILFLHGWQKSTRMIPSLDGDDVIPLTRTSDLGKQEMSELIDFIQAWGAENGVIFRDTDLIDTPAEKRA